jgi:hypothetical protein
MLLGFGLAMIVRTSHLSPFTREGWRNTYDASGPEIVITPVTGRQPGHRHYLIFG